MSNSHLDPNSKRFIKETINGVTTNVEVSNRSLRYNGYFLAGYQSPELKGALYFRNLEGLVPVLDENGKLIILEVYAGKDFYHTPLLT